MLRCMGHRPCIEEWFSPGDLDSVLGDSVEEILESIFVLNHAGEGQQ